MDLLRTLLIYMAMIFVSSVQTAPEPSIIPEPTATVEATAEPTLVPTPTPTPVPTPAITPNKAYKMIKVGDKGDGVLELQKKLAEYGYYDGELDGRFGNQTRRAVEQFQYTNGLSADGVAGRYTLTVLYESGDVRPAPSATPDPDALTTAKPIDESTPIPIGTGTPTPSPTRTPTPTPKPTSTPAPTPTGTPVAGFVPMSGYSIGLEGGDAAVYASAASGNASGQPLEPYMYDVNVYVPLIRILDMANVLVIPNETLEITEYAFALGNDIYRIAFTENQSGEPEGLSAYMNNQPQTLPVRDARMAAGELYLPMESVESLTGIHFDMDDELKRLTVTMP